LIFYRNYQRHACICHFHSRILFAHEHSALVVRCQLLVVKKES
jgi:hypothetical protein